MSGSTNVLEYPRQCSLIVADATGNGLDLSEMAVEFRVEHGVTETPNNAVIRVYNLAEQTAQMIQKEFTQVILRAGYAGNFGIIFQGTTTALAKGNIDLIRVGRESPTETYLDIFASDGDEAYNFGIINVTLASGHVPNDIAKQIGLAMGVKAMPLPSSVPQVPSPRGKALYGMARDHARDLAKTYGLDWGIHGGVLEWLPQSAYKPGTAVVLNGQTGLIGYPQQTENGISARCLLNPSIGQGSRVQINSNVIQSAAPSPNLTAANTLTNISRDGFYKVLFVDHTGETRGNPWYTDMVCLAIDATVLPTSNSNVIQDVGSPP